MTIEEILQKKRDGQKIAMLTAYDYAFAKLADISGADIILVGDSLANVVLGLESTKDVTIDQMLYHAQAVRRAAMRTVLVADMPYEAYQAQPEKAAINAKRFIDEAGCDAVKVEWFDKIEEVVNKIKGIGIKVMGHVGLTPQTADELGGFRVQGKTSQRALEIISAAKKFEELGCFSVVLECVPEKVAKIITASISIPTIGIGAGNDCDGQVLVMHDLLGLLKDFSPKFAKKYANLAEITVEAMSNFVKEVQSGEFPDKDHSFSMSDDEFKILKKALKQ